MASLSCGDVLGSSFSSFEVMRVNCDIFSDKLIAKNDLGSLTLNKVSSVKIPGLIRLTYGTWHARCL